MRLGLFALLLALSIAAPLASARDYTFGDPILWDGPFRPVGLGEDLWVGNGLNALLRVRGGTGQQPEEVAEDVREIAVQRGILWTLRQASDSRLLIVAELRGGLLIDLPPVPIPDGLAVGGLTFIGDRPAVLTERSLWLWTGGDWREVRLKSRLRTLMRTTVAVPNSGSFVYLANDHGQWGGGLQRVEVATGRVLEIEGRGPLIEGCRFPLDKDCDAVTGLVPDPENPDCILAAVGRLETPVHGRLLRACGDKLDLVFSLIIHGDDPNEPLLGSSRPFFGLVVDAEGAVWTASPGQLFRLKDGVATQQQIGELRPFGGLHANFDRPGLAVLADNPYWREQGVHFLPMLAPDYPAP